MITTDQAMTLQGKHLMGAGGERLGTIDTLYADREGGEPTFATVHTGLFGTHSSFVPLQDATMQGDSLVVPYDKELVKAAPRVEPDAELSPQEEEQLYAHYGVARSTGMPTGQAQPRNTAPTAMDAPGTVGHDASGPTTDTAMTRSEERLHVGTEAVEAGRARLRKYIVTETETRTVPVSHEEVRVTREPITDGNIGAAMDGPALSEEEHEVVLTEQRPVVSKETVPVERVRLDKETVTEQQTVTEQVRKEQIETDGAYPGDAGATGRPLDERTR